MNTPQLLPLETDVETAEHAPWKVILFNDNVNTFDDVIRQLVKATGCSNAEAARIAMQAHENGKEVAYSGPFFACLHVNDILSQIRLLTEIQG